MKKVILFIAIFLAIFSFSFGQDIHRRHISNADVAVMMHRSAALSSLKNPDLIRTGYYLLWEYPDGYSELVKIKKGDCLWKKAKYLLENYIPQRFPIDNFSSNYYVSNKKEPFVREKAKGVSSFNVFLNTFSVWTWTIFVLVLALLSVLASKNDREVKEKERKNKKIDIN